MIDRLEALDAEVLAVPVIRIAAPEDDGRALDDALGDLANYDWLAVTSMNGARAVIDRVDSASTVPPIACVGPGTARFMTDAGFDVALIPEVAVGEGLVDAFPEGAGRVLLPQAEVARPVVAEGVAAKGWSVDRIVAYRTLDAEVAPEVAAQAAVADVITFTSSSTVERWLRLVGADKVPPVVAVIGPITAEAATAHGLEVTIAAEPHTADGLVDAIVNWAQRRRP